MCYEVSCTGCGNATFAGCGRHVDAVRLGRIKFEGKEGRKRWGCRSWWWVYSSSLPIIHAVGEWDEAMGFV